MSDFFAIVAEQYTWDITRVGLGVPEGMLGPPFPSCPNRLCLYGSGVPRDSPLEGHSSHSPWDFALVTPGKSQEFCILIYF